VEKSSKDDYVIRLNKVRKVFKQLDGTFLEAVDSVSVGIKTGECFTLLGINGAGKTTLFKILTGDHKSTSGEAHIKGYDVNTEMNVARYQIGYCP
jgi:ATP-binding cassette subfamily A (ABC1) protein 3